MMIQRMFGLVCLALVTDNAREAKALAKAMKKVRAPFSGQCGAVLLIGKPAGADAALAAATGG